MTDLKKTKWHKRHVTIDTPCHLNELESIIHAIGEQGGWSESKVDVDSDKIVITFGNETDEDDCQTMKQING